MHTEVSRKHIFWAATVTYHDYSNARPHQLQPYCTLSGYKHYPELKSRVYMPSLSDHDSIVQRGYWLWNNIEELLSWSTWAVLSVLTRSRVSIQPILTFPVALSRKSLPTQAGVQEPMLPPSQEPLWLQNTCMFGMLATYKTGLWAKTSSTQWLEPKNKKPYYQSCVKCTQLYSLLCTFTAAHCRALLLHHVNTTCILT